MKWTYLFPALLLSLGPVNPAAAAAFLTSDQESSRSLPAQNEKKETCVVSGTVVALAGGEPIKGAAVRLKKADDENQGYTALTDAGGHFQLKDVEAGRYRLEVSRDGFVSQQFGQKTPDDPGALLTLSPGENLRDRVFRLIRSGVIAGKIMDEDGQPLSWVMVTAMRDVYNEGKRKLSPVGYANTNDLGEYRLFGLGPGRYFVTAHYTPGGRFFGSQSNFKDLGEIKNDPGYVTTYYPGTADVARATAIAVGAGEELPSMDMLLRRTAVFKVRGRVYNSVTNHSGGDVYLNLAPKNTRVLWDFSSMNANVQKDGSFEFHDVLSGSYTLMAYWFDEGKTYVTRLPIEVSNASLDGLSITIAPGVTVEGRLFWEGKPAVEQGDLKVSAVGEANDYWGGDARVVANGVFSLKDMADGVYRIEVGGISPDCFVKSVRYGPSEVRHEGFTVRRGVDAALEVIVSSRGARLHGTVADADGLPAAGVWVVLVPEESQRSEFRLYKSKTTDQHGNFELRGIAPGTYKIFSWDKVEAHAWEDPEFLKTFEEKGEKISFQESDQKSLNIDAIRNKTAERANQ